MHPASWDWGIQTTVEMHQVKWGTASLQLTWDPRELQQPLQPATNTTCAILDNASIKCWGSNISGELGIGDTGNRGDNSSESGDNSSEMGDNLPVISL